MKKYLGLVIAALTVFIFIFGNLGTVNASASKTLNGIYKCNGDTKYTDADDGTAQPMYFYFTPDHKVKYARPEVTSSSDSDTTWYGSAGIGTWKYIGNDTFRMNLDDIYDSEHYEYDLEILPNGLIHFEWTHDNPAYSLGSPFKARKLPMAQSDFNDLFNQSKNSDKEGIAEDGTTKPHDYTTFDN